MVALVNTDKNSQAKPSVTVNHYLADNNPIVQVYDNTGEIIIPDTIETVDENTITVTFLVSTSGFIVVHGGTSGSNAYPLQKK